MDWGSAWSGMFIGLGLVILLVALAPAIGVGLGSTAASIWAALSLIGGFFVGGWVTGQTLDVLDTRAAIIHGILLWALVRIFTLVLAVVVATIFLSTAVNGLLGLIPFLGNVVGELVRSPAALAAANNAATAHPGATAAAAAAASTATANAAVSASWTSFLIMAVGLAAAVGGAVVGNLLRAGETTPR
jgi:hypothetical protein